MADASGLLALGQALDDYLIGEYSPPAGTQTALGFLAGVPVNPTTFQNGGVANPALVQAFLNLVVNKVAPVVDGRFAGSLLPAHQLYASMLSVGTPVAPLGTPAADAYLGLKTMAAATFGILAAPKDLVTAPSNWHDPSNAEGWSSFSTTTSSTQTTSTTTSTGEPAPKAEPGPPTPPFVPRERFEKLWQWRTLDRAALTEVIVPAEDVAVAPIDIDPKIVVREDRPRLGRVFDHRGIELRETAVRDHRSSKVSVRDHRASAAKVHDDRASSGASRAQALRAAGPEASPRLMMRAVVDRPASAEPVAATRVLSLAPRLQVMDLVDAEPVLASTDSDSVKSRAVAELMQHQAPVLIAAIDDDVETSSTQTVDSHELTLSLEYCFVQVSRDGWWNDLLLRMPGWYAPGLRAGDLVPGRSFAEQEVGVPVAMVVTRNVKVSGRWSESDRAAAASHTSIGPWQMSESELVSDESQETATLEIRGMQVVAVVCSLLPDLPPADDPSLPAVAAAAATDAAAG